MSQATRISQTTEAIRTPPKSTSLASQCRTSAACSPIQPIALHFHSVKTTTLPQHPPFRLAAGILGTISALFGLVPVLGTASAVIGAVSGTIGVVNTEMLMNPSPAAPDSQFADHAADLASTLGIYISGLRTHLENTHTGIFSNGINIATLLSNRNSVNRALLNLDCNECLPSSERWMERYLSLKIIKYEWWTQNVFITFMPCRFPLSSMLLEHRTHQELTLLNPTKMARSHSSTPPVIPPSTSRNAPLTPSPKNPTSSSATPTTTAGPTISAPAWPASPGQTQRKSPASPSHN